jgi:hypothetical protein
MNLQDLSPFIMGFRRLSPEQKSHVQILAALDCIERERLHLRRGSAGVGSGAIQALCQVDADAAKAKSGLLSDAKAKETALRAEDAVGVSDLLITKWCITHDQGAVEELVARSRRDDKVGKATAWAIGSMCEQDEAFLASVVMASNQIVVVR